MEDSRTNPTCGGGQRWSRSAFLGRPAQPVIHVIRPNPTCGIHEIVDPTRPAFITCSNEHVMNASDAAVVTVHTTISARGPICLKPNVDYLPVHNIKPSYCRITTY